jgi:hypothetical protein
MMIPFLACSHQHHKSAAPSYVSNAPAQCDGQMFTAYPDLIAYATDLEAELEYTIHNIWVCGEIDMPHWYSTSPITWSSTSCGIICVRFYILLCKGHEMMGSDKICTASCTYVHVLSLCHLYSFTIYLKSHKWELSKDTFASCATLLTTLHLREMN